MAKTVRVSGLEVDLVKWVLRALIGVITFFLVQIYMQVQDMDKRLDRHSDRIGRIEDKVGIERKKQ